MKSNIDDSELINLAIKKLANEATVDELEVLDQHISQSEENRQLFEEIKKVWEGTGKTTGITKDDTNAEWILLQKELRKQKVSGGSFSFLKIAASVTLLIAASLIIFFLSKDNQTVLVANEIQTTTLADGSAITLNVDAELSYPEKFSDDVRKVLLKGEAFFDISSDPQKPFVILTPSIEVRVVGTSFTIKDNQSNQTAEVIVSTGTVEVIYQGKKVMLEVGEKGILNKASGQLFKVFNNDPNYLAWKTKIFRFNDMPLSDVINILNNAYQSSLYLRGNEIKECPVTVSFEGQSLDSIIEVLKATLGLSVTRINDTIEISGEGC